MRKTGIDSVVMLGDQIMRIAKEKRVCGTCKFWDHNRDECKREVRPCQCVVGCAKHLEARPKFTFKELGAY